MTRRTPHLLVALSAHGFGHLAQTAEVVNALRRRVSGVRVTVHTALPRERLAARLEGNFEYRRVACDVGLIMASPLEVLVEETARAFVDFHAGWERRVAEQARDLAAIRPDGVLANVPYLTVAAAARSGTPAVALCSLNWADIYAHYCGRHPEAQTLRKQMLEAYHGASLFLKPEPAMPMPDIPRARPIGTIARRGVARRGEIDRTLGLGPSERLVLVAPGGVSGRLPMERWPHVPGVRWLVQADWEVERADVVALERLGMPFIDILASCDVLLTKPGYGAFTEGACNGVRVLYVARRDWPEEPYLVAWLNRLGQCLEVTPEQLADGGFVAELRALLDLPARPAIEPLGAEQAADELASCLVS